jgi:hypothetical protein
MNDVGFAGVPGLAAVPGDGVTIGLFERRQVVPRAQFENLGGQALIELLDQGGRAGFRHGRREGLSGVRRHG